MGLEGKKVVVVGGGCDTGLAIARMAATAGATAILADETFSPLDMGSDAEEALLKRETVDPHDARSLDYFFEQVSPFDILVLWTPPAGPSAFLEIEREHVRKVLETAFWGVLSAVQQSIGCIADDGTIILFTFREDVEPEPGEVLSYSVSGAIEALVESLSVELYPIRVNAVSVVSGGKVLNEEEIARTAVAVMTHGAPSGTVVYGNEALP